MSSPFFSIIVPVYNVAPYIERCVGSVLEQSFKDFELILVDDGSTDDSGKLCDKFADNHHVKIIHKENGGLSSARNCGLEIATGEYIIFIDSDDYWNCKNGLEHIYDRINKFLNDVVLIGCENFDLVSGKRYVSRGDYNLALLNENNKPESLNYLLKSGKFPGSAWIMVVKSSLIREKQLQFPVGVNAEDIGWINEILVACNSIGAINDTLYVYILNRPGQITSKASLKGCRGMIIASQKWMNFKNRDCYSSITQRMAHIYLVLLMHYSALEKSDRKKIKNEVAKLVAILKEGSVKQKAAFCLIKLFGFIMIGKLIDKSYRLKRNLL